MCCQFAIIISYDYRFNLHFDLGISIQMYSNVTMSNYRKHLERETIVTLLTYKR